MLYYLHARYYEHNLLKNKNMNYNEIVYGALKIDEPVLVGLMQSAALQRLRGVLQHGITGLIGITNPTTRFEHSVGTMLLTRRMGASLPEQIAALLHDVSHTAFSHVIDYVFDCHDNQSYHEEQKEQFMAASDLPAILMKYGYDWRDFLHEDDYSILEQPSPALCADRLDYFLRDSVDLRLATVDDVKIVLDRLAVHKNRIVVTEAAIARWLGYTYIAADQASWANFREVGLYELTAQAIKRALQTGAIKEADFWETDEFLWARLRAGTDSILQHQLKLISPTTRFLWDEITPTFRVSTKLRTLDPDIKLNEQLQPLSGFDPEFARFRSQYLNDKQGQWSVRVVSLGES